MIDRIIWGVAWVITLVVLIIFVPKARLREAWVIFLFKQLMTWLFGLLVVEFKLIEYPVRLFSYANKTSFCFEFFIYPAVCVIFCLYYPRNKGNWLKLLHYVKYSTVITVIEILVEKYTNIITYLHWTWYLTWMTLFITFFFSFKFYEWFFKLKKTG